MRILLINPFVEQMHRELSLANNFRNPLGLASLAAVLEEKGFDVEILDALLLGVRFPKLRKHLLKTRPDVVGISTYTPTRYECFRTAAVVRDTLGDDVKIVFGGPHASAIPEDTLAEVASVDYIVRGEGEYTLLELAETLKSNGDPTQVLGVSGRANGGLFHAEDRPNIMELDELPMPARHKLPMNRYGTRMPSTMRRISTVLTSRGCPARCIFCTRDWMSRKPRYHSPARIADEVEEVIGKYNVDGIIFQDDTFTLNNRRVFEFCDEVARRKLKFKWLCTTRVDCVTKELLKAMKGAGLEVLTVGAESMLPETLKWLKKGFTVDQVRQTIQWANELKLIIRCTYLMGIGNESEEDVRKSAQLARELQVSKLKANVGLSIYPGTPVYGMSMEAGVLAKDYSFARGYEDPEKYYGNNETPRWYTAKVPLDRLLQLRKETEINILFTKLTPRTVAHRARKLAVNLRRHPIETCRRIGLFATSLVKGSGLRNATAEEECKSEDHEG
jgi:radical SAM superfamily enzyme YgiQ (UPF0313 family)